LYYKWYLSTLYLKDYNLDFGHIERVDLRQNPFSQAKFIEDYDSIGKIVIFKGLTDHWPATQNWTEEKLIELYGDVIFKISHKGNNRAHSLYELISCCSRRCKD
jgi:hypothetical protein